MSTHYRPIYLFFVWNNQPRFDHQFLPLPRKTHNTDGYLQFRTLSRSDCRCNHIEVAFFERRQACDGPRNSVMRKFAHLTNLKSLHYVIPSTEEEFKDPQYTELRRFWSKNRWKTLLRGYSKIFSRNPELRLNLIHARSSSLTIKLRCRNNA